MASELDAPPATTSGTGTSASPPVTPRILVFFDYACQFCYLDWPRLKRLRDEHGAELFLVPFELRPHLAPEGVPVESLGGSHSERVRDHMRRLAAEGGLELSFPDFVPNTHLALVLGEYGRDLGPESHERVHEALFAAYSGRSADIGRRDVLMDIAGELGLDPGEAAAALEEGRYEERIHQFSHLALALGVSATPAALICNELLIGSRPYRVLADALERCLIDTKSIETYERGDSERHPGESGAVSAEGEPPSIVR